METKLMKTDGFSSIFFIECSISEYIKSCSIHISVSFVKGRRGLYPQPFISYMCLN